MTTPPSDLASRLGFAPDARVLIVNADDFGMCRSANAGIAPLLQDGLIGSATIMTPCAWAPAALEFAAQHPTVDVGLHLVFTSEWQSYRWRPVGPPASSLVDADGYLPRTCAEFEQQAEEDDVVAEMAAQLAHMRRFGVEPSHADNHMGSLYGLAAGRDLLELVLRFCAAEGLPFRLPRSPQLRGIPLPPAVEQGAAALIRARVALADELGVVIPDHLWTHSFEALPGETYESLRSDYLDALHELPSGVTEYYVHPAVLSDELESISADARKRDWERRLLADPLVRETLEREGIRTATWRDLQNLQRGAGA